MATTTIASIPYPSPNPFHISHLPKRPHLSLPFPSTTPLKLHPSTSLPPHFHFYPHSLSFSPLKATHFTHPQPQTQPTTLKVPTFNQPHQPHQHQPVKTVFWVLFWASVSLAVFAFSKDAKAAADVAVVAAADTSIKASGFGLKVADALRSLGWPDEAVVFALATLPVIELRGAIPVGYWMQLKPVVLTVLAVLGNMVPVPFIVLYLKKFATFVAGKNQSASRFIDMLFERAKEKVGPVEEFQWLGLMLFVAVPFPGTGAWTGAIIASVLDMPFWSAVSANFFGVVLAGLIVNFLVNLGLKYAIITGVILFIISTFMWNVLRSLRKSLASSN